MLFKKNVKYCEAECGEHITSFADEIIKFKEQQNVDVIGNFNNILIEVKNDTTKEDIINYINNYKK